MKFTDEDLSKLLDGEMNPSETTQLRSALQNDQDLAARYTELAIADMRFSDLIDAMDQQPISDDIYQLLASDIPASKGLRNSIGKISHSMFRLSRTPIFVFASLAVFAFGLVSAFLFLDRPLLNFAAKQSLVLSKSYYGPDHPLSEALFFVNSDTSQNLDGFDQAIVMPILSFKSPSGRLCREFLLNQAQASIRSVACRQNSGWQIVLSTETQPSIDSDQYQPATGAAQSLYEKRINDLVDGEPLSVSDERKLIENNWRE